MDHIWVCSQTEIIASENNVGTLQVPWCVKKPDAVEDVVRSELGRGLAPLSTSPASSRSEATVLVNTCLWACLPLTKQSQPLITPLKNLISAVWIWYLAWVGFRGCSDAMVELGMANYAWNGSVLTCFIRFSFQTWWLSCHSIKYLKFLSLLYQLDNQWSCHLWYWGNLSHNVMSVRRYLYMSRCTCDMISWSGLIK